MEKRNLDEVDRRRGGGLYGLLEWRSIGIEGIGAELSREEPEQRPCWMGFAYYRLGKEARWGSGASLWHWPNVRSGYTENQLLQAC